MSPKISTEAAIITTGVVTAVTSIYNSERAIKATKLSNDTQNQIDSLEAKVNNLSNKMDNLLDKLNVQQTTSVPTEAINLENIQKSAIFDIGQIDPDSLFSLSLILFSLAALSATLGLAINLLLKDKELVLRYLPKCLVPLYNYYLSKNIYPISYNIALIIFSLLFILILGIYMNIRGIA